MNRSVIFAAALLSAFALAAVNCIGDKETTCEVLRALAANETDANCTTNGEMDCDAILCSTVFQPLQVPIAYNITVLPCNNPPGFRIRLMAAGKPEVNEVFTASKNVTIAGGVAVIQVTLKQLDKAIEVEVRAVSELARVNEPVLEKTEIPIECEEEEGTDALDMDGSANGGAAASHLELTTYWLLLFSTLLPPLHFIL